MTVIDELRRLLAKAEIVGPYQLFDRLAALSAPQAAASPDTTTASNPAPKCPPRDAHEPTEKEST